MNIQNNEVLFSAADLGRLFQMSENSINLTLEAMGLQERPEGFDPSAPPVDTGIRWRVGIIPEIQRFLEANMIDG